MMKFSKITEQDSLYTDLETLTVKELLAGIHTEDQKVTHAIGLVLPAIEKLITRVVEQLGSGGRLFYMGPRAPLGSGREAPDGAPQQNKSGRPTRPAWRAGRPYHSLYHVLYIHPIYIYIYIYI